MTLAVVVDHAEASIDLAHSLGLRVVAEGVEDEATLSALADFGADQAQGFFIARAGELNP
jgi:diguanylate cyclase